MIRLSYHFRIISWNAIGRNIGMRKDDIDSWDASDSDGDGDGLIFLDEMLPTVGGSQSAARLSARRTGMRAGSCMSVGSEW